jgi:nuclear transcription Y subunit beta|tara:strand:- start:7639 stop:7950 length:312 start_codon:yes stop_codon:yes gene_type:complete
MFPISKLLCTLLQTPPNSSKTPNSKKTISGEDLLWAMSTLGFNKYVEPLKHYLTKYREVNKEDNNNKKKETARKLAAQQAAQAAQAAAALAAQRAAMAEQGLQ